VAALVFPRPAHEAPLPPIRPAAGRTRVRAGVRYAARPGFRPLELDLWLPPESPDPVPAVLFLHGGGWRMGSRHLAGPAFEGAEPTPFELMAQAGLAVASADYRLSGEARWPAPLHDAKAAVRWLRARAGELGLDGQQIAAWGESAGGHLAELVGLTGDDPSLEGDLGVTGPSSRVSAVVAWYAPSDLRAMASDTGTDPMDPDTREAGLLGAAPPAVPDAAAQASPVTHVSPGAPPFLLLHGSADRLVPCAQSERLHRALRQAGASSELTLYDDADHMWAGPPGTAQRALEQTIAALSQRLLSPR
jgi:acetyl esterase/lipase